MSSADIAVKVFRTLESEDFRVLQVIETAMSEHEFVPKEQIAKFAKFSLKRETDFRLGRLGGLGLVYQTSEPYVGYTLNYSGYDCLAINALVRAGVLEAFGKPLGVGKEADVYDALNSNCEKIAVKFHRLGRISFRQTRRKRSYSKEGTSWLYQSRLAAEKEYQALQLVYPNRVAVPKPISQNRHVVAMGIIDGADLAEFDDIPQPEKILKEILRNIRIAYLKAGVVHADLSEYNVILKPDAHILIIDWPQYVTKDHPNAQELLERDIRNTVRFFKRKHLLKADVKEVMRYVNGSSRRLAF